MTNREVLQALLLSRPTPGYREMIVEPGFGMSTFVEMFVFVGILGAGLAYIWRRGALDWD